MIGEPPKSETSLLREGKQGNLDTVSFMKRVARERAGHPKIQKLARAILLSEHVPSSHYATESKAIGRFVQRVMRYLRDPSGYEQLQDPLLMIDDIQKGMAQGDCDDMSLLIATLLLAIGHDPKFRVVRYRGSHGPFNHIYVVDYEKNHGGKPERIVLDAIIKDQLIGYEVPHASGEEIQI